MNIFRKIWDALRLRILDRYIIGKFLRTYFFAIAMIIVVVIIFHCAEMIDDFLESKATFGQIVVDYFLNFIPYFVNQFSGLFTFIAVIFFTSKLAYNTEIIAILSAGVGFRRLMYPYFVAALLITSLTLSLNLFLIPDANARRIAFEREYLEKRGNRKAYDRYIYRQVAPNTFAFIRDYNEKTQRAAFFVLESYDGGKVISSIQAQNAFYNEEKGSWGATKYTKRIFKDNGTDSLVKSNVPLDTIIDLNCNELGRVEDLVQTMTSPTLNEFIKAQEAKGSDMVALFQVEAHSRYAYSFATFVLTLIGVSLSSRKVRGGTGLHIGVGIALCFSYIVLMRFAAEFAKSGALPAMVAIWAPNVIYFFIGVYLYIKAPK